MSVAFFSLHQIELLNRLDRIFVQQFRPALQLLVVPVSVGAPDIHHPGPGQFRDDEINLRRGRIVRINQQSNAFRG